LIALRHAQPVLRSGQVEAEGFWRVVAPQRGEAFGCMLNSNKRYGDQPRYLGLFNAGNAAVTFSMPSGDWQVLIDGNGFVDKPRAVAARELTVEPGSGWLLSEPATGGAGAAAKPGAGTGD
jgi:hypothetical protein